MRKTIVCWVSLAVLALPPVAVFAQKTEQVQQKEQIKKEEPQKQIEPGQPTAESTEKQAEAAQPRTEDNSKLTPVPGGKALGMSILGNQEAPKALVIVPWKASELGNGPSVSTLLDDSRLPVDKEVFMRMLSYYEIRSESAGSSAPADANATAPATAAPRRKP